MDELVRYVDLDGVGVKFVNLEAKLENHDRAIAKFMLVIMVQGICSNWQYPLAAFAPEGITADFLYPIIWKAIEVIQVDAGLQVLFIKCDGASSNRKFFTLQSDPRNTLENLSERLCKFIFAPMLPQPLEPWYHQLVRYH